LKPQVLKNLKSALDTLNVDPSKQTKTEQGVSRQTNIL